METFQCPNCTTHNRLQTPFCVNCGLKLTGENFARLLSITGVLRDVQRQWHEAFAALRDEQLREYEANRPKQVAEAPSAPASQSLAESWTPKSMQSLLLSVGAILLSAAALLFVIFAWSRMGLGGRTMVMLGVTALFGFAGYATHKRGLSATGEALTSVAVALTLIDVGAAYSLNFGGIQAVSPATYWSMAFAGTAAVAALCRAVVPIRVLGIVAMIVGQLPVPLLLLDADAPISAWAFGIGVQSIALAAMTQPLVKIRELRGIAQVSVVATWGLMALIAGTATLTDAGTQTYLAASLSVALTVLAAFAIAYVGSAVGKQWTIGFLTAAFALGVATALSMNMHLFDEESVFVGFAVTGLAVIASVVVAKQTTNPVALMIATVPSLLSIAPAIAPTIAAVFGATEWAQLVWTRDFQTIASWNVSATDVLLVATAAIAVVMHGYIAKSQPVMRTATGVSVLAGYLALVAAPLPYAVIESTLVVSSLVMIFAGRNRFWLSTGAALGAEAVVWSLAATPATLIVLAFVIAGALAYARRSLDAIQLALVAVFAEVLSVTQALHWSIESTGIALIVVAAVIAPAVDLMHRRQADVSLSIATMFAMIGVMMTSGDHDVLAIGLLIASAGAAVVATQPHRRALGWVSASLLIAALWTRLAIAGVHVPEAYTLPVAALTLVAGYRASSRHPELSSWSTYGTGLVIGVLPSLTLAADSETLIRPGLLAWASLAMLLIGASTRMKAPVIVGTLTLLITAGVQFGPYVNHVPRWATIGLIGALLISVGATYERRLHDVRKLHARYDTFH